MSRAAMRGVTFAAWRAAAVTSLFLLLLAGLTAAAGQFPNAPLGLAPCWLACGVAIGPAMRWPMARALPATALAMIAGSWLGGGLGGSVAMTCVIAAAQCAAVAWGLRRTLPRVTADPRPLYRVRLGYLSRFLFAITLPASLAAGALAALACAAGGMAWVDAFRLGGVYAAASGLSIAVLAPLLRMDRLRAVSWPLAAAAAVAAFSLPLLSRRDPWILWLAPALVMLAGYFGSTWFAALTVACIGAGLLVSIQFGYLAVFDGPAGFIVLLLVVWRLLMAGFLMSLWSERRARPHRAADAAKIHATVAAARAFWRRSAPPAARWCVLSLEGIVAAQGHPTAPRMLPGSSLRVRVELSQLARQIRPDDVVVGLGACGAMLMLRLRESDEPDLANLVSRCRAATHEGVVVRRGGPFGTATVAFLLDSAAHLEAEPADECAGSDAAVTARHEPGLAGSSLEAVT